MARYIGGPDVIGPRTDHSEEIAACRARAERLRRFNLHSSATARALAADLLEIHDATGISLDDWDNARRFVEEHVRADTGNESFTVLPNGV